MFSHEAVLRHFFSADRQRSERRSTSLISRCGVLYSYGDHWPLAAIVANGVVLTSTPSSRTTNRHRRLVANWVAKHDLGPLIFVELTGMRELLRGINCLGDLPQTFVLQPPAPIRFAGRTSSTQELLECLLWKCKEHDHPAVARWVSSLQDAIKQDLFLQQL